WVDPRLRPFQIDNGDPLGYTRCSRAGLIYFYNNDESYARMFRDLALNTNLIAGSDHYHSHMHALIWDLIEESPVFSDADRRAITAKLLQHARGADGTAGRAGIFNYPEDKYMLDRHNSMRANCFLTESRYFNKYWPAEEWQQNLAAVKRYFNRQMTNGKGGSDLGGRGIYSYLECVLIPMQLLHDRRFIDSGALRHYADLNVMHCDNLGYMPDTGQNSPTSYPVYTLMKSATFLNDGSYLEPLAIRERGERIGGFAVTTEEYTAGQAWATGLHAKLPEKMLGLYSLPLTRWEWEILGRSIPIEKSLDKLTLRSGFGRDDQYLLFDGLHGQPFEKPHPDVNAILHFTQYGRPILVDDGGSSTTEHGVVSLSREVFGQEGGRVASLEAHANLPRFGYFQSRAAAHSFSQWDRHLFWRKGKWFVTIDRLKMKAAGNYSLECNWRPVGFPQIHGSEFIATQGSGEANDPRLAIHIVNAEQLPLRCNEISSTNLSRFGGKPERTPISRVRQVISRQMPAGQENIF
ncbi:MAG TPA: hypothetical protein VHR86_05605, partial [Armatimonadota bacterium]|nr:hypothetical protein [Armatimonadota bacterium]